MPETPRNPELAPADTQRSFPLLLTFDYEEVARPCDFGDSTDTRTLAVGFVSLSVMCISTGQCVGEFDLRGQLPSGFYGLFGLSRPEPWGIWSDAKRTCLLLSIAQPPANRCKVLINYEMIRPGPNTIPTQIRANAVPAGAVLFEGTVGQVEFVLPEQAMSWERANGGLNVSAAGEPQPELSIIVVNYNRWELTFACVLLLTASEITFPYEIIVVDNGSSAAEFSAVTSQGLPVRVIRLNDRRSFGEANNLAAEQARASKLLLLNNDAFVESHCINRLAEALSSVTIGAATPVLEYPDGRLQEAGGFINVDGSTLHRNHSNFQGQLGELPPISPVEYASAACLMIRTADFLQLGGFDPAYEPAYNEDTDLCCRLRATGKRIALVREAKAIHLQNATLKTLRSTDPLATAPARSGEIFRSRWGKWLWTRDSRDLPAIETLVFDEQRQADSSDRTEVNVVIASEPLREDAWTHGVFALSTALAREAPTLICTSNAYSNVRLLHLARNFSLTPSRITTADESSLNAREVDVLVHATCEIPPPVRAYGSRRILYCPQPVRAQGLSSAENRARVDALMTYEAVVTNSDLAIHELTEALRNLGASALPIVAIHPPIADAQKIEQESKENLIVSIGPIRRDGFDGPQGVVLRGFDRFQAASHHRNWQLVCMGEIRSQEDLAYLIDLRMRAAMLPVRFLLTPTKQQKSDFLRRAKICVSANGSVVSQHREGRLKPYSGVEIGSAVSHGCVPITPAGGVEAEICDKLGVGFRFHRAEEIEEQLSMADALASKKDVVSHLQRRVIDLSTAAFYGKWQKLLGYGHRTGVGLLSANG